MTAPTAPIVSDLSTCDECDCTAPVFYHQEGKHLCGKHLLGCLCAKWGWDGAFPNRHHSRCPLAPPPCGICGGLLHVAEECSMNEGAACIYCSKEGHWSQSCEEVA